jgi:Phage tail tube protein, GTA-gp10
LALNGVFEAMSSASKAQARWSRCNHAKVHRGEASIEVGGERLLMKPTFGALGAAEEELGSLFEMVERAVDTRAVR